MKIIRDFIYPSEKKKHTRYSITEKSKTRRVEMTQNEKKKIFIMKNKVIDNYTFNNWLKLQT